MELHRLLRRGLVPALVVGMVALGPTAPAGAEGTAEVGAADDGAVVPLDLPSDLPSDPPSEPPSDLPTDLPTEPPTDPPSDLPTDPPLDPPADEEPPLVTPVEVSPAAVVQGQPDAVVHVTFRVSDASGVAASPRVALVPRLDGPGGSGVDAVLVDGTATDGTWAADVAVPADATPGEWDVVVRGVEDVAGNVGPEQVLGTVLVTLPVPDTEAPHVTEARVTPPTANLSPRAVPVRVSVDATDASGVVAPVVELVSPTSVVVASTVAVLVAGDAAAGTWEAVLTAPQGGPAGTWTVRLPGLSDALGNDAGAVDLGSVRLRYDTLVAPVPVVTGTARVGAALTASAGTWYPSPVALTYQWRRNGVAIPGATGVKYKLVTADAGASITVSVRGTRSGYAAVTRTSAARVAERLLTATPAPTVTGTARVGSTLTATAGAWKPSPVTLTYQWKRDGEAIEGATSRTYKLVTADAGRSVTVAVRGTRSGYTTVTRTSAARRVERLLTATPVPTVTGVGRVGVTLRATAGAWKPSPVTLTYQWKRNGTAIPGATAATYALVKADAGASITVSVRGARTGYTPVTRTSAARQVERLLTATPAPTVAGARTRGAVLVATAGAWKPSPVTLTYQWRRDGTAIAGATAARYTLTAADADKVITVAVTGKRAGYTTVTRVSAGVRIGPARPADKDCKDFATWAAAQAWFTRYQPYYGDFARLDGDGDGIACESLPGAPPR